MRPRAGGYLLRLPPRRSQRRPAVRRHPRRRTRQQSPRPPQHPRLRPPKRLRAIGGPRQQHHPHPTRTADDQPGLDRLRTVARAQPTPDRPHQHGPSRQHRRTSARHQRIHRPARGDAEYCHTDPTQRRRHRTRDPPPLAQRSPLPTSHALHAAARNPDTDPATREASHQRTRRHPHDPTAETAPSPAGSPQAGSARRGSRARRYSRSPLLQRIFLHVVAAIPRCGSWRLHSGRAVDQSSAGHRLRVMVTLTGRCGPWMRRRAGAKLDAAASWPGRQLPVGDATLPSSHAIRSLNGRRAAQLTVSVVMAAQIGCGTCPLIHAIERLVHVSGQQVVTPPTLGVTSSTVSVS